jgi:hypothetical protein
MKAMRNILKYRENSRMPMKSNAAMVIEAG